MNGGSIFAANYFPIFAKKIFNPFAMSFLVVDLLPFISKTFWVGRVFLSFIYNCI